MELNGSVANGYCGASSKGSGCAVPVPDLSGEGSTCATPGASPEVMQERWLRISSRCRGSRIHLAEPARRGPRANDLDSGTRPPHGTAYSDDTEQVWNGFCSVCKRPLSLALTAPPDSSKRTRYGDDDTKRCAYVVALWGTSPEYVLGAMVLGYSLRKTGTLHDLVVVHTPDVTTPALELLRRAGWTTHEVEHVEEAPSLTDKFIKQMRFAHVFTKLRVLGLVQYAKILMMDIDLLVRDNIDDLFDLEPPVAMVRGPEVGYQHGERVEGGYFFSGFRDDGYSWGQSSGINAGVMLLRPGAEVFDQMLAEVTDDRHPEHINGNGPEQDYLSRFYASEWRHLSVAYNFQLHHVYFALSPANEQADRLPFLFNPDLIKVYHYSSEPKPWSRKLEEEYQSVSDEEWLHEVLMSFSGYSTWVLKDLDGMRREGERSGLKMGPDNKLHRIDESKWPKARESWAAKDPRLDCAEEEEQRQLHGEANKQNENAIGEHNGHNGHAVADTCKRESEIRQAANSEDSMFSEDGYPLLSEPLEASQEHIDLAKKVIGISQDLWFAAYNGLQSEFGKEDLTALVRAAALGPITREPKSNYEWPKSTSARSENMDYASAWSRDGAGGWWSEGPVSGRFVATCSTLPQPHASLIAAGSLLFAGTGEGIHLAVVSPSGASCRAPKSFPAGSDCAAAAAAWVESVPTGSVVLLALIDASGAQCGDTLEALAKCGLGCPSAMPPSPCAVAAAVGRKGMGKWYATHAAAEVALASHAPVNTE